MNRRDAIGTLSVGGASLLASSQTLASALVPGVDPGFAQAVTGTAPVKIPDIKTILTAPNRIRLVIVKVATSEPGSGLGCATFTQRALVVQTAVEQVPQAVPRRPQRRRDRGHLAVVVRQLVLAERPGAVQRDERRRHGALGHQGQARRTCPSISCWAASAGSPPTSIPRERPRAQGGGGQRPRRAMEQGYRHVRVQVAIPGLCHLRRARDRRAPPAPSEAVGPTEPASVWEPAPYSAMSRSCSSTCAPSSATTSSCCTTSTSGSRPTRRSSSARTLEQYRLFFIEDPFPPEEKDHFRLLRQQTSMPIAMGELFNTQQEYVPLIAGPADRLHPDPHLADRRPEPGAEGGGALRVLRREDGLARPGRRLAGRPRRAACPGAGELQLRHPRGRRLPAARPGRSSPAAPR